MTVARARTFGCASTLALCLGLVACATSPVASPSVADPPFPAQTSIVTSIALVQRDWHTDVCIRSEDADPWLIALAHGFDGARFLCFGFGDRRFVVERDHGITTAFLALFPADAALLMTVLRATPQAAFGAQDVVDLPVSESGLKGLRGYLRMSFQAGIDGMPQRLGEGPYAGSLFFAATSTYDVLHTCNTWSARALRAAGINVDGNVLFAGSLMRDARRVAATQSAPAAGAPR